MKIKLKKKISALALAGAFAMGTSSMAYAASPTYLKIYNQERKQGEYLNFYAIEDEKIIIQV